MTTYPQPIHAHRPHVGIGLVVAVVALAALVGLGSWMIVDRRSDGGDTTRAATALIDVFLGSARSGDATALIATLRSDAVMWSIGTKIVGARAIGDGLAATPGLHVERTGPVTVEGDFAATSTTLTVPAGGLDEALMVDVFQLEDGQIAAVWVNPPFESPVTA